MEGMRFQVEEDLVTDKDWCVVDLDKESEIVFSSASKAECEKICRSFNDAPPTAREKNILRKRPGTIKIDNPNGKIWTSNGKKLSPGVIKSIRGIRVKLIAQAEKQNAPYPQYKGHWNGWTVVRVLRRIKTKAGVAFEEGDLVLCCPDVFSSRKFRVCYSWRNELDTLVEAKFVGEAKTVRNSTP